MRVAVIGTGHVGLVTAAALATLGHAVVGVDADAEKIATLQEGRLPFHEPGLDDLLAGETASGRLRFTDTVADAVSEAEIVFVCVGRPPTAAGDRSLPAVEDAARAVARHAGQGVVIVEKSTVPPGTAERMKRTVSLERPDLDFEVVSNPEFLREGRAVQDTLEPDRIVVGVDSQRGLEVMRRLYEPLTRAGCHMIETDVRTAELAKLACNAFLALKVSYANALARISELAGADVVGVTRVMGTDPRIGEAFLGAGMGFGGYCLPKDLVALENVAGRLGYDFGLLREVARINEEATEAVARKIEEAVWNVEGKRVALLGLAFKPGTDDIRGAPALALARRLLAEGAEVVGYDPLASVTVSAELPELIQAPDAYEAASGAHCLVLCTEWEEFERLDLVRLREAMAYPVVVDGRNLFDPEAVREAGFSYYPTGRQAPPPTRPRSGAATGAGAEGASSGEGAP